jgi:hypothetical protein
VKKEKNIEHRTRNVECRRERKKRNIEYRTRNIDCRKERRKKNEERKKKNEYRKMVHRRRGTSPAAGVYLPEGRLPSTFGVPCSLFDIPAAGGSPWPPEA